MVINFYPEQDKSEFERATIEYSKIWKEEGSKITTIIEKISGLNFKEKIVNAIVYNEVSYSSPLQLQSNISLENKKSSLVHELCHRIVVGNNIVIKSRNNSNSYNMKIHKHIDLILYDIWVELYSENFAKKAINFEISLWNDKGISPYETAWNWALSMTREERQSLWKLSISKKLF